MDARTTVAPDGTSASRLGTRWLARGAWVIGVGGALLTFALLEGPRAWQPWARPGAPATPHLVAAGPALPAAPGTSFQQPSSVSRAPQPVRLEIARAGVDAAVEPVGVDAQGRMGTPADARDVGWYEPGSRPGEPGDAVIDGHLEWYSGPAVFANLHAVRAGDAVIVATATSRLAFVVDRVDTYPYDAVVPGLFAPAGPPQLSLITCTGVWDPAAHIYLGRLVVHATLAPDMTHL